MLVYTRPRLLLPVDSKCGTDFKYYQTSRSTLMNGQKYLLTSLIHVPTVFQTTLCGTMWLTNTPPSYL